MKKLFANKTTLFIVLGAAILVIAIAWVILSASATQKAVVLNTSAASGTTITEGMLKEIDVPRDTPGEFKKSKQSLVGERLTVNVEEGQLIYKSNVTSGIDFKTSDNDEFINCSILLEDDQAMGGLLTAGNKVDVAVMPKSNKSSILSSSLPGAHVADGQLTYILANVTLLDTTTALSSQQGSTMSVATGDGQETSSSNKSASYYMLALSYNDYKKLRIAEACGTIYLNMCPKNNDEHAPLLDQMSASVDGTLVDSAPDPIKPESKNNKDEESDNKNKESDNRTDNNNNNNNNNANKDED